MKYTRINVRSEKSLRELKWLFAYLIIIPLVALAAGKILSQFFITPYIQKTANSIPIKTIQAYDTVYMVQAGVFSNKDNADIIIKAIQGNNYKPVSVVYDNEYWIVIDTTYDIKIANNLKDKLKSIGYDCIVNKICVEEESDKNKENKDAVQNIKNLIKLSSIQIYIKDNKSNGSTSSEITKYESKIKESYDNIKKKNTDFSNGYCKIADGFNDYEKKFKDNINSNSVETYNTCISQELLSVKKMIDYCNGNK